ncbi:porin [Paraburkholderia silviterrae]|uniref:Porin n=1 Tax=Paraburkholderia silviterrae TaxID=2528715 RepID=A0A4R5M0M9_9BURK|nr:porin [Paraburkholderia silviterrae]
MHHRGGLTLKVVAGVAVALFAGGAYAQSSVTLYGALDTGVLYTSKTAGATVGQNAGKNFSLIEGGLTPSVFGLTGTEDLGGGLKVSFKLESGINPANGGLADCNGNLFGCQAWVALNNQYGTLKAGLQYSPFFLALYESDPRDFALFGSSVVNYVDNALATGAFSPNSVSYTSPELAGFQGSVLYSLGGTPGDFQAGRQYSASLKYEVGGFMINASIFDSNAGGSAQTPVQSALEYEGRTIGAAYKIGPVTMKLSFVNYKVSGSFNNNVYGGGLDYLVTPAFDMNAGVWVTSDRNQTANHSVLGALGATYFMSKRTSFYAQVGTVNNRGLMNTGISLNGALYGAQGTTVAALVGLRHAF